MYPPCAKCAGGGESENVGGTGGGAGGGTYGSGRWKLVLLAAAVESGEDRLLNEYTRGPVNGFAYFFQHFLHGLKGSASLYPTF